ncbi:unnamed protein product [Closterium sp. Yama58-4]|nr:unnamed protein product [Closterium sp. Yama58-4]
MQRTTTTRIKPSHTERAPALLNLPPTMPRFNRREQLPLHIKRALCAHHVEHPLLRHVDLARWVYAQYGLRPDRSTVGRILKNAERWALVEPTAANQVRCRGGAWPELEQAMARWIANAGPAGVPLTLQTIRDHVATMARNMGIPPVFRCSIGWVRRALRRQGVRCRAATGEAASADMAAVREAREKVPQLLTHLGYKPRDTFNLDETALWLSVLPRKTYSNARLPGRKVSKDRLTVAFLVNADGSHVFRPLVISKARRPHDFRPDYDPEAVSSFWTAGLAPRWAEFMAAKTTKDGRALLKPVVVRQKAQHPETDGSDLVANLIEAAKKMHIRKLRRTIVDIKQSSKNPSGGRAPGAMSPALGLGNVSALESRPLKKPLVQPSINGTDDKGRTALHFSCGMASTECAVVLLESGAEVNVRDNEGFTPLHMAAGYGRSQSVELLLKAGGESDGVAKALAKLEARSDVTWIAGRAASLANAFSAACRNGHVGIAETLLKSGASVDAVDGEGATPLLAAADSGFANCVQLLLEVGAQPDARDKVGVTPLIAAAYNGHEEALSALVRHGAGVDARSHGGVTPLIAAAEGRHARCIHLLVQAGADVNARTSEGKTALMHAVGRSSVPATEALLAGGADVSAVDGEGLSALHHGARLDAADCVELLCAKGASMTKRCKKGRTALMDAPKGSASAAILEEKWKALEEEVARRQLELLELFADDAHDAAASKPNAPVAAGAKSGKDKKKAGKGKSKTPKGIASLTSKLQGLAEGPGSAAGSAAGLAAGSVGSAGLVGDVQNLVVKTPESSSRPSMSPSGSNGCACKQSHQCEEITGELARRVAELEAELRAARAAADAARAAAAAERARAAQLEQQLISGRKATEIISARDKSQIQILQQSLCSQSISLAAATASAEASRRALASSHSDWHSQLHRIRCQAVAAAVTAATASWQAWESSHILEVALLCQQLSDSTAASTTVSGAPAETDAAAGAAARTAAAAAAAKAAAPVPRLSSHVPSGLECKPSASVHPAADCHTAAVGVDPLSHDPMLSFKASLLAGKISSAAAAADRATAAAAGGIGSVVAGTARIGASKLGDADDFPADEEIAYPLGSLKPAIESWKVDLIAPSHGDAAASLKASFLSRKLLGKSNLDRSSSMEFLQGVKPGMKAGQEGSVGAFFSSPHHHHDTTASIMRKIALE